MQITVLLAALALGAPGWEATVPPAVSPAEPPVSYNVRDLGAVGDGKADDTAAFEAAMRAASQAGGGLVSIPTGTYFIAGNLDVPDHVTLEGVFRAPTARTQNLGSTLLAVADKGNPDGQPFITLHANSTLHGLTVFYPEQTLTDPPVAYPWTVRGIGDNCSIVDVLLVNPYQAVDFGTYPAGRHYIKSLYAQALYKGIFVDQCYDIGRIEDVHLWPFWDTGGFPREFTLREGEAFILGRTDWEYMVNCFCIGYKVGYHFIRTNAGEPNVDLVQCGSDVGPCAVQVDACQGHAGVVFTNGQFMAGIQIKETNSGPVKFMGCGFWGIESTASHAVIEGSGQVTFDGCHFNGWDRGATGAPCIHAKSGGLTVMACDFMDEGKNQITLEPEVEAAVVVGNRLRGGAKIDNRSEGEVQIGLNAGG